MKKLATTLSALFLCGLAFGQSAMQKQVKPVGPGVGTMHSRQTDAVTSAKTMSERFKQAYMAGHAELVGKNAVAEAMGVTLTGAGTGHVKSAVKVDAVNPPFICHFDYGKELEDKWTVVDGDKDGRVWDYQTGASIDFPANDESEDGGFVICPYNKEKVGNDWMITKAPVRMPAGKAHVAFHYGLLTNSYPERLNVYYGSKEEPDVRNLTKIGTVVSQKGGWTHQVYTFDIATAGDYYFFFQRASEPNTYYLLLDDIEIGIGEFVGQPDLILKQVILPVSTCGLGASETIGVQVRNCGTGAITSYKLATRIGDGAVVEETVNERLEVGASQTVVLAQKVDLSAPATTYAVEVTGTILAQDGKDEEKTANNVKTGYVTHFSPLESLPLVADFRDQSVLTQFGYGASAWEYWEEDGMLNAVEESPLVTRCMHLEKDQMYRFNFRYMAGFEMSMLFETQIFEDNFELVYGKIGTPIEDWVCVKSFYGVYTKEVFVYQEVEFLHDEESGDYAFAIVPGPDYLGTLCVSYVEIEQIKAHNVKLAAVYPSIGVQTPARHAVNPRFDVAVANRGKEAEDVKVSVKQDGTSVGTSEVVSVKRRDTAYYTFTGSMEKPAVGSVTTLLVEAELTTDEYPVDNRQEWRFTVTNDLYAFDRDVEYEDGIGTQDFIFGNIFTLAATDTLKAVVLGWYDLSDYIKDALKVGLEIYPVDETGKAGLAVLVYEFDRQPEGGLTTVEVPARVLPAGRYFVALRQTSATNMSIGYDAEPGGIFYVKGDKDEYVEPFVTSYGNVAVRALFGQSANLVGRDIELLEIAKPRDKGEFAANEPIEVRYRSNGTETVSVTFNCSVDGVDLESKTVTVSAYDYGTVSFTGDLLKRGVHAIRVEAVLEGDEVPENNMVQKSVESVTLDPYTMDFELCDDFAITGLMPWTTVDMDSAYTYGMAGINWDNVNQPMGFMAFNPSATTPSIEDVFAPHGGERMGAAFVSINKRNNDWLISPKLKMPAEGAGMSFYVAAFVVGDESYTEEYKVMVSTTTDEPGAFKQVGRSYKVSALEWSENSVDLSAYNGQDIHVAIQCVSNDQYIFMIDDIRITRPAANEKAVDLSAFVKTYPNPVTGQWHVTAYGLEIGRVEICNMAGALVYRSAQNLATETYRVNTDGFKPGLYMARIYTNAGLQVTKMVVR